MVQQIIPKYTLIIPLRGHPYTNNGIIYIPLDFLEKHFAVYGINKETVFKNILQHEILHIINKDSKYHKSKITTPDEFEEYANYRWEMETAALPSLRFDNDDEYKRLNEISLNDLEALIEIYRIKYYQYGELNLVEMALTS